MRKIVATAAILALAGCAPTYYNPNVTQEQADMDSAYCQMVAIQAGGLPMDMASAGISGIQQAKARELCFRSKGYIRQ